VGRAFELLVAPPTTLVLDGGGLPGLPAHPLGMQRLRRLLLSEQVSSDARDAVWRQLVMRARRPAPDGQTWTVIAAGMALPGLTTASARLCRGWRGETADLDAEVLAGFVARLATLDLSGPRVVGRLIDAGVRAGRRARDTAIEIGTLEQSWPDERAVEVPGPGRIPSAGGHPDGVLARAVACGVLDRTEAHLIGATRLEHVPLAQAAAALRLAPDRAADWRWRAESRLAAAIRAGEVGGTIEAMPDRRPDQGRHALRLALVKAERYRPRPGHQAPAAQ
jgi:hypothetical protein